MNADVDAQLVSIAEIERWRAVVGWGDLYEVSDHGRVRRIRPGKGTRMPSAGPQRVRVLCPSLGSHGYLQVSLSRDGHARKFPVHWLVAEAFLGRRVQFIDHVDGDRRNNKASNLRYVTVGENNRAAAARRTYGGPHGTLAKLTPTQVIEIRAQAAAGASCADLATRYPVSAGHVKRIVARIVWASVPDPTINRGDTF